MRTSTTGTTADPLDKLPRATTGVDRGVGRLILQIGDEDEAVARRAILALHDLGPGAFLSPLAESFARSASFRMRGMILEYDTIGRPRVIESLLAAPGEDR